MPNKERYAHIKARGDTLSEKYRARRRLEQKAYRKRRQDIPDRTLLQGMTEFRLRFLKLVVGYGLSMHDICRKLLVHKPDLIERFELGLVPFEKAFLSQIAQESQDRLKLKGRWVQRPLNCEHPELWSAEHREQQYRDILGRLRGYGRWKMRNLRRWKVRQGKAAFKLRYRHPLSTRQHEKLVLLHDAVQRLLYMTNELKTVVNGGLLWLDEEHHAFNTRVTAKSLSVGSWRSPPLDHEDRRYERRAHRDVAAARRLLRQRRVFLSGLHEEEFLNWRAFNESISSVRLRFVSLFLPWADSPFHEPSPRLLAEAEAKLRTFYKGEPVCAVYRTQRRRWVLYQGQSHPLAKFIDLLLADDPAVSIPPMALPA